MSTVELEKLEIVMEIDTEQVQQNLERLQPRLEKLLGRLEQNFGRMMGKVEDDMDISNGVKKTSSQMEKLTDRVQRNLNRTKRVTGEFGETMQSTGGEMASSMEGVNQSVQKLQQNVRRSTQSIKQDFEATPQSLELIGEAMERNERVIDRLKNQMRLLNKEYEAQRTPLSLDPANQRFEETKASLKTLATMQKLEVQIAKVARENDVLQRSFSDVEDRIASTTQQKTGFARILSQVSERTQMLRSNIDGSGGALSRKNTRLGKTNSNLSRMKQLTERAKASMSRFGGVFNRTSNTIAHGSRKSALGFAGISQGIQRMMRNLFVFNLLRNGLMAMGRGMMSALQTNDQFNASLNQIRGNLMTAFYPIFRAVLPAINALMSALARATAYLASFISLLFGTTFEASRAGAQGLYTAAQGADDLGSSARGAREDVEELQRSLMGFDEINRLDGDSGGGGADGGGAGGPGGIDWGGIMDPGVPAWLENIMNLLERFFDPIKQAWNNVGYRVIQEWQHMTEQIWRLIRYIARDFMYVWTDGTGQRLLEQLLILLANIMGVIGDIAKAFADAWDENERGRDLIRSIFHTLESIVRVGNASLETFRLAWNENERGQRIAANILEIFTNIFNTVGNLAENLANTWRDSGHGQRIWGAMLDIINSILTTVNRITGATREWAQNLDLEPLLGSIADLFERILPIVDRIGNKIYDFWTNTMLPFGKWLIQDFAPAILDSHGEWIVAGAILGGFIKTAIVPLVKILLGLWKNVLAPLAKFVKSYIAPVFKFLWEKALVPLGKFITNTLKPVFSFLWKSVLVPLAGVVKKVLIPAFLGIKAPVVLTVGVIIGLIEAGLWLIRNWEEVREFAGRIWNTIKESVSGALQAVISFLVETDWLELGANIVLGITNGISNMMATVGTWLRELIFDPIVNTFKRLFGMSSESTIFRFFGGYLIQGLMSGIGNLIMGPINLVTGLWNDIRNGTNERLGKIRANVSERWGNIRDNITDRVSQARDNVQNRWQNIRTNTVTTFNNVRNSVRDRLTQTRDNVRDRARDIFNNVRDRWRDVNSNTDSTFNNVRSTIGDRFTGVRDTITNQARGAYNASRDNWREMSRDTTQRMNEIRNQTRDRWNQLRTDVANTTTTLRTSTRDRFNQIRDEARDRSNRTRELVGNAFNRMRNESTTAFNGIRTSLNNVFNQIENTSRGLGQRMANAINRGAPAMRAAANNLGNSFNSSLQQVTARMPVAQSFSGGLGGGYGGYGYGSGGGILPMIDFAHDYLGASQGFELTLPNSIIGPSPMDSFREGAGAQLQMRNAQNEREKAFMQQIIAAIKAGYNNYQGETTIILQVDGTTLGRICVKELNRITNQSGVFPLQIR